MYKAGFINFGKKPISESINSGNMQGAKQINPGIKRYERLKIGQITDTKNKAKKSIATYNIG